MTIWSMRIACWIKKCYTHTLRICNTYCFSTATVLHISCLVYYHLQHICQLLSQFSPQHTSIVLLLRIHSLTIIIRSHVSVRWHPTFNIEIINLNMLHIFKLCFKYLKYVISMKQNYLFVVNYAYSDMFRLKGVIIRLFNEP